MMSNSSKHIVHPEYEVIPISSKERILDRPSGKKMTTQTYENLKAYENVEGFIDLAFLTREKVADLGYEEFVLRNLALISHACQVIEKSKPKWVVLVSSGAVFKSKSDELETSVKDNPYGFLKRVEELLIADVASRVGANVVIGRLWGAMGRYMPVNRAYALSDFLCQALEGGPIEVRSGHEVFRRYCDAGEFMKVLIKLAQKGETCMLNSGGPLVEIGELASGVASHFESVKISRPPAISEPIDDYYPRSNEFEERAQEMKVELTLLSEQVARTVVGHRSQFTNLSSETLN